MVAQQFEHFAPYVQLMAGFNFAYILVNFYIKAFDKFSTIVPYINNRYKKFDHELSIVCESLDSMDPISTKSGYSNKKCIEEFSLKYRKLKDEWKTHKEKLEKFFGSKKIVNGFPLLFFWSGLYCVVELILFSVMALNNHPVWIDTMFYFFTILVFLGAVCYLLYIVFKGDDELTPSEYKGVVYYFSIIMVCSTLVPLMWNDWLIENGLIYGSRQVGWVSLAIPILPFAACMLYLYGLDKMVGWWSDIVYWTSFKTRYYYLTYRKTKNIDDIYTKLSKIQTPDDLTFG